jgi:hypothetical protein
MARSQGLGRVRYRLQVSTYGDNSYLTIITIGPSLTGPRGTQLTGSTSYTLVTYQKNLGDHLNFSTSYQYMCKTTQVLGKVPCQQNERGKPQLPKPKFSSSSLPPSPPSPVTHDPPLRHPQPPRPLLTSS